MAGCSGSGCTYSATRSSTRRTASSSTATRTCTRCRSTRTRASMSSTCPTSGSSVSASAPLRPPFALTAGGSPHPSLHTYQTNHAHHHPVYRWQPLAFSHARHHLLVFPQARTHGTPSPCPYRFLFSLLKMLVCLQNVRHDPVLTICTHTHTGRILAIAIMHGKHVDAFFIRPFYKTLLGIPIKVADMEVVDPVRQLHCFGPFLRFPSSKPPRTRRVTCYICCQCLSDAD